jgi:hypothetical protein
MLKFINLCSLLLLANCIGLYAQKTIVSGKIFDRENSEPIPFANICFQHSLVGTVSDIDGTFFISTFNATDTLMITSVGYETARVFIKKGKQQQIEVKLNVKSISLKEVVVTPGENPAFKILKQIEKNKKFNNPDRFQSYQYKSYTKLRLDMNNIDQNFKDQRILKDFDFVFDYMDSSEVFGKNYLPMLISESVSKFYFQRNPPAKREVIEAFKISGIDNKTVSQFSGKMYQQLNIYDNFMTFFEPGFVSPIADFGRLYYKYFLEDSTDIDNNWCYKISFKPKRKQERTFYGYFWVADTSFAIKKFQLRVSSDVNLNLLKDMIAINEFKKINDSTWFLTNEDLLIDFNLAEKTYGFFGRKTAVYDSIIVDQPIPSEITGLKTDTYYEDDKLDHDSSFWEQNRKADLSAEDGKIYKMVDSVQKVPMYKTIYGFLEMLVNYYIVTGPVEIGPYYTLYSTNPVEGSRIRIGGRTSNKFSTKIMFGGHLAYGLKDEKFKYGLYGNYMFNTNPRVSTGASYYHDIRQLGKSQNAFLDDNILTSILRRTPNRKLTMVNQCNVFFEREWFQGFSNTISFRYQTIFPTKYVPFRLTTSEGDTIEQSYLTSTEFTLTTHFAYHEKFLFGKFERTSLGSHYPAIDLDLTYGPKGFINSSYEYFRVKLKISDKVETNPIGFFKYRFTAGKTFGRLPYPLLDLHEGNETYAYDPMAFNMMNYYEFVSDEFLSFFAEQHFQGFFLNRIPLLRDLHWREVVSGNILFGNLSAKNHNVMAFPNGLTGLSRPYYEGSVGIENIFKILRIDAMWRLSYLDNDNIQEFSIRATLQLRF